MIKYLFCLLVLTATSKSGCQQDSGKMDTLAGLYETYQQGMIRECQLDGKTYFKCGINAHDAVVNVYNEMGERVGQCNYAFNMVDDICEQLKDCEMVWCMEGNIWGYPAADKYNLKK